MYNQSMKKVDELLQDYAFYHQTPGNVVCHFIGVPSIILGILSVLQLVKIGPFSLAEAVIAVSTIYYLLLDARLALSLLLLFAVLDAAAYAVGDYRVCLGLFVIGWIFQGIGHAVFEKRSPAFLRNLVHLLVGPMFLVNKALRVRVLSQPASTSVPD